MPSSDYAPYFVTSTPTDAQRINFLEALLRAENRHEPSCPSQNPTIDFANWKLDADPASSRGNSPKITQHACNCWLTKPFGTVGLTRGAAPASGGSKSLKD